MGGRGEVERANFLTRCPFIVLCAQSKLKAKWKRIKNLKATVVADRQFEWPAKAIRCEFNELQHCASVRVCACVRVCVCLCM